MTILNRAVRLWALESGPFYCQRIKGEGRTEIVGIVIALAIRLHFPPIGFHMHSQNHSLKTMPDHSETWGRNHFPFQRGISTEAHTSRPIVFAAGKIGQPSDHASIFENVQ